MAATARKPGLGAIQSICFGCHTKGGIAGAKLTGKHSHPLLRDLRRVGGKTTLPLFSASGQRSAKGRLDCATCHDPHRWNPHQAGPSANAEREGTGTDSFLRKPASPDAALCLGCHADGHVAGAKVPANTRHPRHIPVWSGSLRRRSAKAGILPEVPVYDNRGRRAMIGRIVCATCHDPHRWDPRQSAKGPGRNREGDATDSYLRNASSRRIVCADCHGRDAIFRYKYFHGRTSRRPHPLYR
jgi:formate-dependent nitrite reductase cytochrome c552 subunit